MIRLFFAKHLQNILLGVILMLGAALAAVSYKLNSVRAEAAEARAALTTEQATGLICEANTVSLESAVSQQNKATEQLAEAGAKEAGKVAREATKRLKQPLPVFSDTGAAALNRWLESK